MYCVTLVQQQLNSPKACGVKRGDEVITQAFNFIVTVDCWYWSYSNNCKYWYNKYVCRWFKKNYNKTKAVIPVHMLGFSANIKEIEKTCVKKSN